MIHLKFLNYPAVLRDSIFLVGILTSPTDPTCLTSEEVEWEVLRPPGGGFHDFPGAMCFTSISGNWLEERKIAKANISPKSKVNTTYTVCL